MKVFEYLPELEGEEAHFINDLLNKMPEEELDVFTRVYRARRKDPILMLVLALLGLFGVAGIHRFLVGQIGMGLLYFFTVGLCFVGTIVDMINYKNFAFEYNQNVAVEIVKEMNL
ncbi:MAG: TM2 domain-containing protein [Balneolaceae bacterium]|nr:TM2 domain-containing protein [Balneolaceae bacterium]